MVAGAHLNEWNDEYFAVVSEDRDCRLIVCKGGNGYAIQALAGSEWRGLAAFDMVTELAEFIRSDLPEPWPGLADRVAALPFWPRDAWRQKVWRQSVPIVGRKPGRRAARARPVAASAVASTAGQLAG